jgi:hypothetical protein
MKGRPLQPLLVLLLASVALLQPNPIQAGPVAVRYPEGLIHGFLTLQTLDGSTLADGDLIQTLRADRVTDHMIFHFKDGSLYDETFVFTQRGTFRLLTEALVEKGPAFKHSMESSLNTLTGEVKIRYTDDDGKEKLLNQRLQLPPDLTASAMLPILLKNLPAGSPQITVSLLAATPKPRLVKLVITRAGQDPFSTGASSHKANRYTVKVEIGGAAGWIAPMVGQQPPDTSVWILAGEAPSFLKSEGPLYAGGPMWRIQLVSPAWPQQSLAQH